LKSAIDITLITYFTRTSKFATVSTPITCFTRTTKILAILTLKCLPTSDTTRQFNTAQQFKQKGLNVLHLHMPLQSLGRTIVQVPDNNGRVMAAGRKPFSTRRKGHGFDQAPAVSLKKTILTLRLPVTAQEDRGPVCWPVWTFRSYLWPTIGQVGLAVMRLTPSHRSNSHVQFGLLMLQN